MLVEIYFTNETNKRKTICKCGADVPAGAGRRYSPPLGRTRFLCSVCVLDEITGLAIQEQTTEVLTAVREFCDRSITRGMESITFYKIRDLVLSTGVYMLEVAEILAEEIGTKPINTYGDAVQFTRNIIQTTRESVPFDQLAQVDPGLIESALALV